MTTNQKIILAILALGSLASVGILGYVVLNSLMLQSAIIIPTNTPEPTNTPTVTKTRYILPPTWTPSPTPIPSDTPTPGPTQTPIPSPTDVVLSTPTPMTPGKLIKNSGVGNDSFSLNLSAGKFLITWTYSGSPVSVPAYEAISHENYLANLQAYYDNMMAIYNQQKSRFAAQNDALGLVHLQGEIDAFVSQYNQQVQQENDLYNSIVASYADNTQFVLKTNNSEPDSNKTLANFTGPGSNSAYIQTPGGIQTFIVQTTGSWKVNVSFVK